MYSPRLWEEQLWLDPPGGRLPSSSRLLQSNALGNHPASRYWNNESHPQTVTFVSMPFRPWNLEFVLSYPKQISSVAGLELHSQQKSCEARELGADIG